ncbi:MAG: class I SAM-dependent methyltransferase [Candidatus Woesearchaeota archaeon]
MVLDVSSEYIKNITKNSYGTTALSYERNTINLDMSELIETLCARVPSGTILDIGFGHGRDLNVFENKGYSVIGIEITPEFIPIARKRSRGILELFDVTQGPYLKHPINGIWSCGAFHHFPRKTIEETTYNLFTTLQHSGSLCVSTKKGTAEELSPDTRYGGVIKYWSFYTKDQLFSIFKNAGFDNIDIDEDEKWLTVLADKV